VVGVRRAVAGLVAGVAGAVAGVAGLALATVTLAGWPLGCSVIVIRAPSVTTTMVSPIRPARRVLRVK